MNYNLIAYCFYFVCMAVVIIKVGQRCHLNGVHFIRQILPHDHGLADRLNNLLLIGYCLINIGYVLYTIASWEALSGFRAIVEALSYRISIILLLLGVLHFFNIFFITKLLKRFIHQ